MAASGSDMDSHVETMQTNISEAWRLLNNIWTKFGYDDENLRRRQKAVVKHVSELLSEMVQEADERLNEQQLKLDNLMKEIAQLAKDLSIDSVPELDAASGKTLLEMEQVFLDVANVLRKRKATRMEKYNSVNEQLLEVCEELEETPMRIEFEGIPADSQVAKLEQHLVYMHQEKSRRADQFNHLRKCISELFGLLERSPKNELEYLVTNVDEVISSSRPVSAGGIKALSTAVLEKLEAMYSAFTEQLESNTQKGNELWQKIRDLWSRLNVDEELIQAFTHVNRPISKGSYEVVYKPSVLKGLCVELERLEEEKRQNMSLFVKQVREELTELWISKCFMASVEDRFTEQNYWGVTDFAISDFTSDVYTEELLEKHEREVEFWRCFVERNKTIIDGVIKRGHMFAQYKTLDQKSDDPSRLANRGGALLKEEKERKKLEKTIPKLEGELKQLCQVFEEGADGGYGMQKFLVYGRTIDEMIEQDWEQFHEEKRLRKEAKKKPEAVDVKNRTLMTTQMGAPGSSRKRPAPATPSSALKSGATTPNKRNRTQVMTPTPGKTIQSPFLHPSAVGPTSANKRPLNSKDNFAVPATSGNRSAKKTPTNTKPMLTRQASSGRIPMPSKVTGKEQVPPKLAKSKSTVVSPVSSYSEFTENLLCQSTLNSSVVAPLQKTAAGAAPGTPTKSGMSFAPAKLPLSDNRF